MSETPTCLPIALRNKTQSPYQGRHPTSLWFYLLPLARLLTVLQLHRPTVALVCVVIWWQGFSKLIDNHDSLIRVIPSHVQAKVTKTCTHSNEKDERDNPQKKLFQRYSKHLSFKLKFQPLVCHFPQKILSVNHQFDFQFLKYDVELAGLCDPVMCSIKLYTAALFSQGQSLKDLYIFYIQILTLFL